MKAVSVGNKTLPIPVLVPSISSFETQLDPIAALQLQYALHEPVSLVSAYDIKRLGKPFEELCQKYQQSGILLLDSGGYEHSHAVRYAPAPDLAPRWTVDDFKAVCALPIYDFAFSFDYFWCENDPNESVKDFENRLSSEILSSHDYLDPQKLIPVLHLHAWKDDAKRLSEPEILSLVIRVASDCQSPFLAIPERELGDGLIARYRLAKKISDELAKCANDVGLHILGCGNLLSFAYFAVAGVRMADGLEWYRTFVADNFHLHHFQQEPVFVSARAGTYSPAADLILAQELPYRVKVATLNLVSLQSFSTELVRRLPEQKVNELVTSKFGEKAGLELRSVER